MRVGVICLTLVMLTAACEPSDGETRIIQRDSASVDGGASRPDTLQAHADSDESALPDTAWTNVAQSAEHDSGGVAVIAGIREAEHAGFDRIRDRISRWHPSWL